MYKKKFNFKIKKTINNNKIKHPNWPIDPDGQYIYPGIYKNISELSKQRKNTQPIKDNTGGSTFKNPKNYKAWQLIKSSGCEKLSVGGAHISELHANFIVNDGSASSSDIEELGEEIKKSC